MSIYKALTMNLKPWTMDVGKKFIQLCTRCSFLGRQSILKLQYLFKVGWANKSSGLQAGRAGLEGRDLTTPENTGRINEVICKNAFENCKALYNLNYYH